MKSHNTYNLPVKIADVLEDQDYEALSFNSHTGSLCYALDFLVAEGTLIYAVHYGVVVYVKQDSKIGGPDPQYWNEGNRIVLRHSSGEYSAYEHLRYMGATVSVGQLVACGQPIGYSGNTGCSSCPHLHFEIFINPSDDESEGQTVEITFADGYQFPYDETVTASAFL